MKRSKSTRGAASQAAASRLVSTLGGWPNTDSTRVSSRQAESLRHGAARLLAPLACLASLALPAFSQPPIWWRWLRDRSREPSICRGAITLSQRCGARQGAGYVERIVVDRGSAVKQGELLAELSAPRRCRGLPRPTPRRWRRGGSPAGGSSARRREATFERLKKASERPAHRRERNSCRPRSRWTQRAPWYARASRRWPLPKRGACPPGFAGLSHHNRAV